MIAQHVSAHHMTSHCITWHDTTQAITPHQITWAHITSTNIASKQVTSPPWNSRRLVHSKDMVWASRWSVALRTFYRQILSLLYSSFFLWNFRPRLARELLVVQRTSGEGVWGRGDCLPSCTVYPDWIEEVPQKASRLLMVKWNQSKELGLVSSTFKLPMRLRYSRYPFLVRSTFLPVVYRLQQLQQSLPILCWTLRRSQRASKRRCQVWKNPLFGRNSPQVARRTWVFHIMWSLKQIVSGKYGWWKKSCTTWDV